ncbi:hypothetical protein [Actinoplanes sp. NPDC049118]|uniref:hypothetical protein n=1 Tax=Actinoplanes sp. NPDC049118 TaxID=3155769 RepID=UPI0034056FEC
MTERSFKPGDPVTVLPPYDRDPYILTFQRHAKIAAHIDGPTGALYMINLDAAHPPNQEFGPFSEGRLAPGWRN